MLKKKNIHYLTTLKEVWKNTWIRPKIYLGPRPVLHLSLEEIWAAEFVSSCWQTNKPTDDRRQTTDRWTDSGEVVASLADVMTENIKQL